MAIILGCFAAGRLLRMDLVASNPSISGIRMPTRLAFLFMGRCYFFIFSLFNYCLINYFRS